MLLDILELMGAVPMGSEMGATIDEEEVATPYADEAGGAGLPEIAMGAEPTLLEVVVFPPLPLRARFRVTTCDGCAAGTIVPPSVWRGEVGIEA